MKKSANDTLSLWREEGSLAIQQHFTIFRNLVAQAKDLVERGQYDAAVVYAQMAANYATGKHCGLFVSQELEQILINIGQQVIKTRRVHNQSISLHKTIKNVLNVLHVSTSVTSIGGHSRMLYRWMKQDRERSHSLALIRQAPNEVPKILRDAVSQSHGKIYVLNEKISSILSWAKQLREIADEADVVVLHIFNFDVVPIVAFAHKDQSPPIIFLDHADHLFWLGACISDLVINLRESGMRLAQTRRGIEAKRNLLLPTILSSTNRILSRNEAKRQIEVPENSVLLLSIARGVKYKTMDGMSFADAHVPLLKRYEQAILVVIGPGKREDWSTAIQQTQGRIKTLDETTEIAQFYQAADIYVDSYPFVSITTLLEAGCYGLPLVSRYPYSDASEILGADAPGLAGNLIRVSNLEDYTVVLSRLVEDEGFRVSLGEETRRKITEIHMGSNWQRTLNEIYDLAVTLPKVNIKSSVAMAQTSIDEPDVFLPRVHDCNMDIDGLIQSHLTIMPLNQRLHYWIKLVKKYGIRSKIGLLFPEWFTLYYYSRLRSLLPFY